MLKEILIALADAIEASDTEEKPDLVKGIPLPIRGKLEEVFMALQGYPREIDDGTVITLKDTLTIRIALIGDSIVVKLGDQDNDNRPLVKREGLISLERPLDGVTATRETVKVHISGVPDFLEPTFDVV